MRRKWVLPVVALSVTLGCGQQGLDNDTVAIIEGTPVTREQVSNYIAFLSATSTNPELIRKDRKQAVDYYLRSRSEQALAHKLGIDQSAVVQGSIDNAKIDVTSKALLAHLEQSQQISVSDAEVKAYYNAHAASFTTTFDAAAPMIRRMLMGRKFDEWKLKHSEELKIQMNSGAYERLSKG